MSSYFKRVHCAMEELVNLKHTRSDKNLWRKIDKSQLYQPYSQGHLPGTLLPSRADQSVLHRWPVISSDLIRNRCAIQSALPAHLRALHLQDSHLGLTIKDFRETTPRILRVCRRSPKLASSAATAHCTLAPGSNWLVAPPSEHDCNRQMDLHGGRTSSYKQSAITFHRLRLENTFRDNQQSPHFTIK